MLHKLLLLWFLLPTGLLLFLFLFLFKPWLLRTRPTWRCAHCVLCAACFN